MLWKGRSRRIEAYVPLLTIGFWYFSTGANHACVILFCDESHVIWRPVAKSRCKHLVARIRDTPADHCDLPHHFIPHQLQSTKEQLPRRRSEEHTSELQSPKDLVCRLLLE